MQGRVRWFNNDKGYGFIAITESNDGRDIFAHYRNMPDRSRMNRGDLVEFDIEEGERGPKAINIKKREN